MSDELDHPGERAVVKLELPLFRCLRLRCLNVGDGDLSVNTRHEIYLCLSALLV